MTTWWQEYNAFVRENRSGHDETLAPHLVALLDDVEARFVEAGGDAMRWDDPHAVPGRPWERRDPTEDEYSCLTNPGKYATIQARLDAWVAALTALNLDADGSPLADVTEHEAVTSMGMSVHWVGANFRPLSRIRTLTPLNDAPALRLTTWVQDEGLLLFEVAAGEPAAVALMTPDCGCDACDPGSGDLLRELDQWILSIVDGSFEVAERGHDRMDRTSFGGNRRWNDEEACPPDVSVSGRSWWPGKRSRPVPTPW